MPQDNQFVLDQAYKEWRYKQDLVRKEKQKKAYDYFVGNEDAILTYLTTAMELTFYTEDVTEMQKQFINITEKLITQLATIYNEPSDIFLHDSGKENPKATKYYNSIQADKNNSAKKTTLYYAKLLNKALLFVGYDKETQKVVYKARPSHMYSIIPSKDNPKKPYGVMIDVDLIDGPSVETVTVVWTKERNYYLDALGNERAIGNNTKMLNPYGVLPFAEIEIKDLDHYWGEIQSDIVNVNEQVNVLLTFLINSGVIMGAVGTPVAVNLGLHKKGTIEKGAEKIRRIWMGPKHPLVVDGIKSDEVIPSLTYAKSDPMITEIKSTIDDYIKLIASTKGVDPNTFLNDIKATSGFSKVMDSLIQLETRKVDIDPCRAFEKQLYNITVKVNNYWQGTDDGDELEKIDEKLIPVIDFIEPEPPKTPKEISEEREFNKKHNLETAIDWLMEDNPDIESRDAALKILQKNKKINNAISTNQTGNLSLAELIASNNIEDLEESNDLIIDEGEIDNE